MTALGSIAAGSDLLAAGLLIYGMKRMSSPVTARSGIVISGYGMLLAVVASFVYATNVSDAARPHLLANVSLAIGALAIGAGWAWRSGKTVPVTAMPQMVAIYNGMGGGAAAAIAAIRLSALETLPAVTCVALATAAIGCVSFSGSMIAWAKLDGRLRKPWHVRDQQVLNGFVAIATLALAVAVVFFRGAGPDWLLVASYFVGALVLGVLITLPIGGADMPVVISLYNAFTGLAVSLGGFALGNPALIVAGMVVGASGCLLTLLMARAMNRSVLNVVAGNFGAQADQQTQAIKGRLKPVDASDAGTAMRYASSVIIVPGYGLAVAQAQGKLYELVKLLQAADVDVKFAIHPVAGRMPGHMDVLLAEAGVPYELMHELEEINGEFKTADVAVVVGANDVVNPAARTDKQSPIYGMPILDVDQAHQIYVIKRGQGTGYSGIENALFYADNCEMVYGDAKEVLAKMVEAVRSLEAQEAA